MNINYAAQNGASVEAPTAGAVVLTDNTDNPSGRRFRSLGAALRYLGNPDRWGNAYWHQITTSDGRKWDLYDVSGYPPAAELREVED